MHVSSFPTLSFTDKTGTDLGKINLSNSLFFRRFDLPVCSIDDCSFRAVPLCVYFGSVNGSLCKVHGRDNNKERRRGRTEKRQTKFAEYSSRVHTSIWKRGDKGADSTARRLPKETCASPSGTRTSRLDKARIWKTRVCHRASTLSRQRCNRATCHAVGSRR